MHPADATVRSFVVGSLAKHQPDATRCKTSGDRSLKHPYPCREGGRALPSMRCLLSLAVFTVMGWAHALPRELARGQMQAFNPLATMADQRSVQVRSALR